MATKDMLPQSIDAEQALLGLILSSDVMDLVADKISIKDFYRDDHRVIFDAILGLYNQNRSIDIISISDVLIEKNRVIDGEVGGRTYLSKLAGRSFEELHDDSQAEQYARIISNKAHARRGLEACSQASQWFYTEDAQHAQAKTEALFSEIGQEHVASDFTPLSDLVTGCVERVAAMQSQGGVLLGVSTGFPDLDHLLSGLRSQKLYLVAGRPGSGKTSLALTLAHAAGMSGRHVGILSLEMSKDELVERLVSIDAKLDSRRVSSGQLEGDEWDRFVSSAERLSGMNIQIDDTFGSTLMALKSKAKRLQAKHGLDLLLVDYLQLMEAENPHEAENEAKMLSVISRGLKGIARELDIPVVALAQLNRKVEERQSKIPQLSDLRGSGSLEQDADVVMFVYREEEYNQATERKGQADLIIAKHRGGPKGCVVLGWEASQTRFYPLLSENEMERYGIA